MIKYLLRIIIATLTFVEQGGKNLKDLLYLTLKDVYCKDLHHMYPHYILYIHHVYHITYKENVRTI